ncbi:MAG: peroxiredoxin [Litoreibacter sp.]
MLITGDMAPDFTLPCDDSGTGETTITLSALRPNKVILYFYPRDDTPGCTKEAIGFTEHLDAFKTAECLVIGISKDTVAKHGKFRTKHDLGVILASDADNDVCEQFGVWQEKSMYGKTFMGIQRATFLIGTDGKILHDWPKVRVPGHVEDVLKAAQAV